MTKRTQSKRVNRNGATLFAFAASAALFVVSGCKAIEEHKCCLFSEDGIFASKKSEVGRANSQDERDALARAAVATDNKKEAWETTDAENAEARKAGIDLKDFVWTTQRPNGGALFPKQWQGPGPALVVEPASIAAPVGTDVIVVASYIGEDSQYLRVGERLDWSLAGIGRFMESNPNEFANGQLSNASSRFRSSSSCLTCPFVKTSQEVDDRYMTTSTTGQLWRVHRGTDTQLDDITILRGQSWASVSAFEEGTSTIVVMSDTIGNWNKRRAVSEIHWIDAAFRFPQSGVGVINSTRDITTTVCYRTTAQPRPGWKVRYDVLSGNAVLGSNKTKSLTVVTDANGNATTQVSQLDGQAGTAKISATVFRPATETSREVEVDQRTFFQTWTANSAVTIAMTKSAESANVGEPIEYAITVTNLSDFYQNVVAEAIIPKGMVGIAFNPPPPYEDSNLGRVQYQFDYLPPHKSVSVRFTLRKTVAGNADVGARIVKAEPTSPPQNTSGQQNAAQQNAAQPNNAQTAPRNDLNPPVVSPDPASVPPTLQRN